jgi:hypothetical protein
MCRIARWAFLLCVVVASIPEVRAQDNTHESMPAAPRPQTTAAPRPAPLSFDQKFRSYLKQTYQPQSSLVPAVVAGLNQARNSPDDWRQGAVGYGKRFSSVRGEFQISNVARFGVGAALHEDPRFFRSNLHGSWSRTKYAFKHTYFARVDDGGERLAFSAFAAAAAGGFAPNGWLPASQNGWGHAFQRTAVLLMIDLGVNMGREFGSDDKKFLFEKILRRRPRSSTDSPDASAIFLER